MPVEPVDITELLSAAQAGDPAALDAAFRLIYPELRRLAHRQRGGGSDTLNTTGLVHECWLRLSQAGSKLKDRGHFFALAARVMRQVLVDYARERTAEKRGGGDRGVALDEVEIAEQREAQDLLEMDDLLRKLAVASARQAQVVECRFFAGLTETETAEALSISERSVQRDWSDARDWLRREGGFSG